MCTIALTNLKLGFLHESQMTLVSSNVHNCTQQPQIKSSLIQMILKPLNVYNFTQQPQIKSSLTQRAFNTFKYAQMHSTNSNQHSITSNMHSSI